MAMEEIVVLGMEYNLAMTFNRALSINARDQSNIKLISFSAIAMTLS